MGSAVVSCQPVVRSRKHEGMQSCWGTPTLNVSSTLCIMHASPQQSCQRMRLRAPNSVDQSSTNPGTQPHPPAVYPKSTSSLTSLLFLYHSPM